MARGKGAGPDPRQTVRMSQLEQNLEMFNLSQWEKLKQSIAAYHEGFIGTPVDAPTVDRRLWLIERLSVKWWIATTVLWLYGLAKTTIANARKKPPAPPCEHKLEDIAFSYDEPHIVCPKCKRLLRIDIAQLEKIADGE